MRILAFFPIMYMFAEPVLAAEIKANTKLLRGDIITASDIAVTTSSNEHSSDILASIVGKQVKRTIQSGQRITPNLIGPAIIVKRNSRVTMIYRRGALQINAFGRALDHGAVGDVVSVMNLDSRKKVAGVVMENGNIEVTP